MTSNSDREPPFWPALRLLTWLRWLCPKDGYGAALAAGKVAETAAELFVSMRCRAFCRARPY
jgi:hypothetical protein